MVEETAKQIATSFERLSWVMIVYLCVAMFMQLLALGRILSGKTQQVQQPRPQFSVTPSGTSATRRPIPTRTQAHVDMTPPAEPPK